MTNRSNNTHHWPSKLQLEKFPRHLSKRRKGNCLRKYRLVRSQCISFVSRSNIPRNRNEGKAADQVVCLWQIEFLVDTKSIEDRIEQSECQRKQESLMRRRAAAIYANFRLIAEVVAERFEDFWWHQTTMYRVSCAKHSAISLVSLDYHDYIGKVLNKSENRYRSYKIFSVNYV